MRHLLFLLSFCIPFTLSSQTQLSKDTTLANQHLLQTDSFIYANQLRTAIEKAQTAQALFSKNLGERHYKIGLTLGKIGRAMYYQGRYIASLETLLKALEILQTQSNATEAYAELASVYNNLGLNYSTQGDFQNAILHQEKGLDIALKTKRDDDFIAPFYVNIGGNYIKLGQYNKAQEYNQEAARYAKSPLNRARLANNNALLTQYTPENNIFEGIELEEASKKATAMAQKGINELNGLSNSVDNIKLRLQLNVAFFYTVIYEYDKAIEQYENLETLIKTTYGEQHPSTAQYYLNAADAYRGKGAFEKAEQLLDRALNIYGYRDNDSFDEISDINNTARVLMGKGLFHRFWYEAKGDLKQLGKAKLWLETAIEAQNYQLKNVGSASIGGITAMLNQTLNFAIQINYTLYDKTGDNKFLADIFLLSEKDKAYRLRAAIYEAQAKQFANLPKQLLQQEDRLKQEIIIEKQKRYNILAAGYSRTDSTYIASAADLLQLENNLEELKNQIQKQAPNYFDANYNDEVCSVQEVQKLLLASNQALIEYFIGDSLNLYIIAVRKDDFQVKKVKMNQNWNNWIVKMRKDVSTRTIGDPANEAFQLYDQLIAPVSDFLTGTANWKIVPDYTLGLIPFDLLSTQVVSEDRPPSFLIQEKTTSLAFSATLWKAMRDKEHSLAPKYTFLGLAPAFTGSEYEAVRAKMKPLNFNAKEIENIQKLMNGKILVGEAATEEAFTTLASDFSIIHFSTHGKANQKAGDFSYLALAAIEGEPENEVLYASEIYHLQLYADMVVLSACETGIGEVQTSEGVISLARAFGYAGAKSVVTSIWQIDDQASADLMVSFYENLKTGMPKDEALRTAKLAVFEGRFSKAYYWAAFVPIGDMSPLELQSRLPIWTWIIVAFTITLLLFLLRQKRKS
ncbi:MAG: CHAT domain-containing tetratricopeptide repeat protein [Bacteroidota bacterium]